MTYFVDVNLPKSFSLIKNISCLFVKDFSDEMPDNEIWKLAISNGYTILTRDKDFYYRGMQSTLLPKIVLFRLGNSRNKQLYEYFKSNLAIIEDYLLYHQLIVLWPNEIQVVV